MKKILLKVGEQMVYYKDVAAEKVVATIAGIFYNKPDGKAVCFTEEPQDPPSNLMVIIDLYLANELGERIPYSEKRETLLAKRLEEFLKNQAVRN